MEFINSNLFSGLIGALIGGAFSLLATNLSHNHQRKLIDEQNEQEKKDYISSIHSELNILSSMYINMLDENVLNDSPDMKIRFTVPEGIFAVYNNNLDKIGSVETELREKVITCYKTANAFIDILKMNNFVLKELEDNERLEQEYSDPDRKGYFRNLKNNRNEELEKQKKNNLIPTYTKLKKEIEELLPLLKEYKT